MSGTKWSSGRGRRPWLTLAVAIVTVAAPIINPTATAEHGGALHSEDKESCRTVDGEVVPVEPGGEIRPNFHVVCARSWGTTHMTGVEDCWIENGEVKCLYAMAEGSGGRGSAAGRSSTTCNTTGQCPHYNHFREWDAGTYEYTHGENWGTESVDPHGNARFEYCHGFKTTAVATLPPDVVSAQIKVWCGFG